MSEDASAGLQQASLPPSLSLRAPSSLLPAATRPVACSAGRSEPAQSPPSPPPHTRLPFKVYDWFVGLPVSLWPHLPLPSVLTPSLSNWLRAVVGTRQPQPGLAEKRLSESQQSNQSQLRSVLE